MVMKRGKAEGKKTNERKGKKEEGEELPRIRTGDQGQGTSLHGHVHACRRVPGEQR
jgi:hypothetical protein